MCIGTEDMDAVIKYLRQPFKLYKMLLIPTIQKTRIEKLESVKLV